MVKREAYLVRDTGEMVWKVFLNNKLVDIDKARISVSDSGFLYGEERKSTLLITATKFQPYSPEYYKNGVLVVLCPFRQNVSEPIYGHKTINYFSRMIALNQARQKRAAESLWFTMDNRLAEGCISNVFLVKDSALYTPPIGTPVLAGVARKTVCQIALKNSIKLIEKDLHISDVLDADEIFLTNVIMQVMPISKVEKHTVGAGEVGPMTKRLQKYFDEYIKSECRKAK